ncbi:MAG TPA: Ig-like domain-containing protein, partial [Prolixibacteraceae bacterium]|nr:Ig-like domain-containing protein [Prolixibacteraceae bacterium]
MKLCGSVNWCRIGWLIVILNLLVIPEFLHAQIIPPLPPLPDLGVPNQHAVVGELFNYTIPANAFKDENNDILSYTLTSSLPTGLVYNPVNRAISGTPIAVGASTVNVLVSDGSLTRSTSFSITVHSKTDPYAAFTMNTSRGCNYRLVKFINCSNNASSYSWNLGNGNTSVESNPETIYEKPGTYTVTLTINGGGSSNLVYSQNVVIYSLPSPTIEKNIVTGCEPVSTTLKFAGSSTGGNPAYYHWFFYGKHPDQYSSSPTVGLTNLQGGKYNVLLRVVDENGCKGSASEQNLFAVYEKPKASFSYSKLDNCSPSVTTFTDQSTLNDGEISNYSWRVDGVSFGGNEPSVDYDFTSKGYGSYAVALQTKSEHGCVSDAHTETIVFNNDNQANFTVNANYCEGDEVQFVANTSSQALSYEWRIDGQVENTESQFSYVFNSAKTYQVTLKVGFSDACNIITNKEINVDRVNADFSYTPSYNCNNGNFTVSFNNTSSTELNKNIISTNWYLVENSTETLISSKASFTYTFTPGTKQIKLVAVSSTGCSSTITKGVILQKPSASITVSGSTFGCYSDETKTIGFEANLNSLYDTPISYAWNFGDTGTASGKSVSHAYSDPGSYTVTVEITTSTGCVYFASTNNPIRLAAQPVIDTVILIQSGNKCFSEGIQLDVNYSSVVDQLDFLFPTETKSINNPGNSPYSYRYNFETPGTYNIAVLASQWGCMSDTFKIINIEANGPQASFNPSQTSFCDDQSYSASFTNTTNITAYPATEFYWDFGDGHTSSEVSPSHEYSAIGDFEVTLTASNPSGCEHSYSEMMHVYSFDNSPGIISASVTEGCAPLSVSFTQKLSERLSSNFDIQELWWDFDNNGVFDSITTSIDPILYVFDKPGQYSVRLEVVGEGCNYVFTEENLIKVSGPIVNFTHSPSLVCKNTEVQFNSSITKPVFDTADPLKNSYLWSFGDGASSTASNPTHIITKDTLHTVSLTVTDEHGCATTKTKPNLFNIIPFTPDFELPDTVFCNNTEIVIRNTSLGDIQSFAWDFNNDGNIDLTTNNMASVSHIFTVAGTYTIALTATVSTGCTKTVTKTIRVVNATADFNYNSNIGCAPTYAYFEAIAKDIDVVKYDWDFGDGNHSDEKSTRNYYNIPRTYSVKLTITFKGGCSRQVSHSVTADGAYGELDFDKMLGCAPNPVLFSVNNMSRVDYVTWDFGTGIVKQDTVQASSKTYIETTYVYDTLGFRFPKVILTDKVCGDITYGSDYSIYTSMPPKPDFEVDRNSICRGVPIQFTDKSESFDPEYGISGWKWYFGNSGNDSSIVQKPLPFAYLSSGSFSPTLIVFNELGCSDTLVKSNSIQIYSNDNLKANFEIGLNNRDTLACAWDNINFNSKANAGYNTIVDYKWLIEGETFNTQHANYQFNDTFKGEKVKVTHYVTDDKFCIDSTSRTVAIDNLQAAFGYEPQPVFRGSTVEFKDETLVNVGTSISSWNWNFDSGAPVSSTEKNPDIEFNTILPNNKVSLMVTNNRNCKDTAIVQFDVLNNPPVVDTLTITLVENTTLFLKQSEFSTRFHDDDPGQSFVSFRIQTTPDKGHFKLNGQPYTIGTAIPFDQINLLEFIPTANWFGETSFEWNGFDGIEWSNSPALVTVIVLPIPPPPTLSDIVFNNVPEDRVIVITRQMFIDHVSHKLGSTFEFDSLTILTPITPSAGTLTFNGTKVTGPYPILILKNEIDDNEAVFRYTPAPGYNGTLSFSWNAHDKYNFAIHPALVKITYTNTAPTLENIVMDGLAKDSIIKITKANFLENYSDIDLFDTPQRFWLTILPPASEGYFTLAGQKISINSFPISFSQLSYIGFKRAAGFVGTTQATWQVSDGTDVGEALIILTFLNAPPRVHDFTVNGIEDVKYTFLITDFDKHPTVNRPFEDPDNDDRLEELTVLTLPQHGTLSYQGIPVIAGAVIARTNIKNLVYLGEPDWNGVDSFRYTAFDGSAMALDTATVYLQIAPVNDAPRTQPDYYSVLEDHTLSAVNVGLNDSDVDNDHSTLRYHVADNDGATAGANGIITLDVLGNLTYEPNPDFNGKVYFVYTNCDPSNACSKDTVYITVIPMNDPPVAVPDTFVLYENELLSYFNTLKNGSTDDYDIDGDNFYMSEVNGSNDIDIKIPTAYGTIKWNYDGSIRFEMPKSIDTLKAGEEIELRFTYQIVDDSSATATSYFLIVIKGLNNPPVANDDFFEAYEGFENIASSMPQYNSILHNDTDIDSERYLITVNSVNNTKEKSIESYYGRFNWMNDGSWTFIENQKATDPLKQGEIADVVFPYDISDGIDLSIETAYITIRIIGVNDNPVAINDTLVIFENAGTVTVSLGDIEALLSNDSDIDGDNFFVESIDADFSGSVTSDVGLLQWKPDGSYIYTPDRDSVIQLAAGDTIFDVFNYIIVDDFDGRSRAQLVIVIHGLNDAPYAMDDSITILEDTHITIVDEKNGLLSNDGDIDRDPIIVSVNDEDSYTSMGLYGKLTWQPNGAFIYETFIDIVDSLYQGQEVVDVFSYTVVDPHGETDKANLYVTIIGQNDAPVANDFFAYILEKDISLTVGSRSQGIISNDSDIDDGLEFGVVSMKKQATSPVIGVYGKLQWNYDGTFTYTLNPKTDSLKYMEVVVDSFRYVIQDRFDSTAFAWFYIEITGENDIPLAVNDTVFIKEDERFIDIHPENNGLRWNDIDIDGDSTYIKLPGNVNVYDFIGDYGILTINANGHATYTLNSEMDTLKFNQTVIDIFEYSLFDMQGASSTANVIVNIIGENDLPIVPDVFVQIDEDNDSLSASPFDVHSLLYYATDIDGDSLMVIQVNDSINTTAIGFYGDLVWQPNGAYEFINNMDNTQPLAQGDTVYERFKFVVSDSLETVTATLIIEILGLNDAPVASPDYYETIEYTRVKLTSSDPDHVLYNDTDIDTGDTIRMTMVSETIERTVIGQYGELTWQADGGFVYYPDRAIAIALRQDETLTEVFEYTLSDTYDATDTSTINITITGINNAPVAINDTIFLLENTKKMAHPEGLLFNDYDPDTNDLFWVYRIDKDTTGIVKTKYKYGEVHWKPNGEAVFIADSVMVSQLGPKDHMYDYVTYTIIDEGGEKGSAELVISITGENNPPVAHNDFDTIPEDFYSLYNVLENDFDPDYNGEGNIDYGSLSISIGPKNGKASVNTATGEVYYVPNKNFNGLDSLMYKICDEGYDIYCSEAWFIILVEPINDAPTAKNILLNTPLNTPVAFNAFNQVADVDDGIDPNSYLLVNEPKNGGAEWSGDSSIVYTPFVDVTGIDEFIYSFADFSGLRAYVIVTVIVPDDRFGAQNDTATTRENIPVTVQILKNDTLHGFRPSPNTVDIKVFPNNGSVAYNPFTRDVTYQPDDDFNGLDSLIYIVGSNTNNWDFATVYITVEPINRQLVANDDAVTILVNQKDAEIRILQNDYDYDDGIDTSSVKIIAQPLHAKTVFFDFEKGYVYYTPVDDYEGADSFTYSVCDLNSENKSCDTAVVYIKVQEKYPNIKAMNDSYVSDEDVTIQLINPLPTDNDVVIDGRIDIESFSIITPPQFSDLW